MEIKKSCVIGSGPAGYTAAIYLARALLEPVVFEGFMSGVSGGQLMSTTEVENYPGFPEGILGPVLMENMKKQALHFGATMLMEDVLSVDCSQSPFLVRSTNSSFLTKSLIIATGAQASRLDIPGTRDGQLWQKGVSACAVCDGAMPLFRNKDLFVIGGGDSAVEEALFLTKYASKVYLVHRRDQLRASKIMAGRAVKHPKIEVLWDSVVEEVCGRNIVEFVRIANVKTKEVVERKASGVFFAVGHTPNTAFLAGQLECDQKGYLKVEPGTCRTAVRGIWAAGDVQDPHWRQAVTAAGSGCMAAIDVERYLSELEA
jgi:thioredoxin reductase (NADPH)